MLFFIPHNKSDLVKIKKIRVKFEKSRTEVLSKDNRKDEQLGKQILQDDNLCKK